MTTLFTEVDLIRYLYGESSENENSAIENAAICDSDFGEELFNMKIDLSRLDNLSFNPSDFILENIFNFSSKYSDSSE
ncbi:MAG: hypothetical protein JXR07_07630 [Reichenbachiella sp.]